MERSWRRATQPPVVELLQEYLVQTGAKPGDKVPTEAEFATELGIGRSGVREGIHALQALGIVEVRHGRGTFLRSGGSLDGLGRGLTFWSRLSLADEGGSDTLLLVTQVRMALETSLVHEVVGLHDDASFAALEHAVAEMEGLAREGSYAPAADRDFHHVLYQPLANWVLDGIVHSFWDAVRQSTGWEAVSPDPAPIAQVHRDILDALRAKDHATLAAAMKAHFEPVTFRASRQGTWRGGGDER